MSANDIMAQESSKKRVRINFISNLIKSSSAPGGGQTGSKGQTPQRAQVQEVKERQLINTINVFGLTAEDHRLLSRSLKFAIQFALPSRTEIDQSFERFARLIRFRFQFRENQTIFTKSMAKFYVPKPDKQPQLLAKIVENYLAKTKAELQQRLTEALYKPATKPNITKQQLERLAQIKQDPNIVVRNADKNLGITLWNKADYLKEAFKHLENKEAYNCTTIVPEQKIKEDITQMIEAYEGLIDPDMINWIKHKLKQKVQIPKFYLLPKLHKIPISSRPITAAHSWLTTGLAVAVDHLLRPIIDNIPEILKDSKTLVKDLSQTIVRQMLTEQLSDSCPQPMTIDFSEEKTDVWLITADVQSLYTVIPIAEGLEATREAMRKANLSSSTQSFIGWAQRLILENNYFQFEGKSYRQKQGAAMGANDAPAFANLFVWKNEQPVLTKHRQRVVMYRRLLDDVFAIIKGTRSDVNEFVHDLKTMNPALKLTVQVDESKINFLDITIFKGNRYPIIGQLSTKPYEKPMNPYLYIPYSSAHASKLKLGWIKAETQRLIRNSSEETDFTEAKIRFQQRLLKQGYPVTFLNKALEQANYQQRQKLLEHKTESKEGQQKVFFKVRFNRLYEQVKIGQALFKHFDDELRDLLDCVPCVCFTKAQTFAQILSD
jgi:hypothetical protein